MSSVSSSLSSGQLKALSVLVVALSLPLAYLGLTSMVAGLAGQQANLFLDDWTAKKQPPSERSWQFAVHAAERALSWDPVFNPVYADTLGRINDWYRYDTAFGGDEAQSARLNAIAAYRQAVAERPLWPYTRVNLAYAKVRALEFDAEFHQQLAEARRLGPWRTRVHAPLAEIGMIAWPQLTAQEKVETWQSLALVLRYDPRRARPLKQLAQQAGLMPLMCSVLDPDLLKARRWCR